MKTSIAGVVIFTRAFIAQGKLRHARLSSIIRNALDDTEPGAAMGAVRKSIVEALVVSVADILNTQATCGRIRGDMCTCLGVFAGFDGKVLKCCLLACVNGSLLAFNAFNDSQRRTVRLNTGNKLTNIVFGAVDRYKNAITIILNRSDESELLCR